MSVSTEIFFLLLLFFGLFFAVCLDVFLSKVLAKGVRSVGKGTIPRLHCNFCH